MKYAEVYERLKKLENKLPEHSCADIKYVRGLAFNHRCRDLSYHEMLRRTVERLTPLAVAERLKQ